MELDKNSKLLSKVKYGHSLSNFFILEFREMFSNIRTFLVVKVSLVCLVVLYSIYMIYKYVKPSKKRPVSTSTEKL